MKPIDNACLYKDFCNNCKQHNFYDEILWICDIHFTGRFPEPCTLEDWNKCPFNKEKNEG